MIHQPIKLIKRTRKKQPQRNLREWLNSTPQTRLIHQGDFVTAVTGTPDTTRFEHGTVLNNPIIRTYEKPHDIQEPFVTIRCWWSNKLIFAHTDDVVVGYYPQ